MEKAQNQKIEAEDYYSLSEILKKDADYNIIVGMRSNGKSYAVLEYVGKDYIYRHKQFVYMRKSDREITTGRVRQAMASLEASFRKAFGEQWRVRVYSGLIQIYEDVEDKKDRDYQTIGYVMSCFSYLQYKSNSYPEVGTIILEEFTAKDDNFMELYGENVVECFFNNVSTVVRNRIDVKIFMIGNTVNRENEFFKAFNIDAYTLKKGHIMLYEYDSGLRVAVEYCSDSKVAKKAAKFFTPSKNVKMITSGEWEIDPYESCWQNNHADKMVLWKCYHSINISRNHVGYAISVPDTIEKPLVITAAVRKPQMVYSTMKTLFISKNVMLPFIKIKLLEGSYIISNDVVAERFFNDLRNFGIIS